MWSKDKNVTLHIIRLPAFVCLPCIQVTAICSNEIRLVIGNDNTLPFVEIINRLICLDIHWISEIIRKSGSAPMLAVLCDSVFFKVFDNIAV